MSLVLASGVFTFCPAEERPYGLTKRVPWTTSNFRGRPEPPLPFRAQRVFPKLNFPEPTVITSAPGTDRLFVGVRPGTIHSIPNRQDVEQADLFLDCSDLVAQLKEKEKQQIRFDSLYGLTFDPHFEENRYCYVCYVVKHSDGSKGQDPAGTRVVRLNVSRTDPPVCDIASEREIITWMGSGHNGGCLKFGPDGYLYISTGDGGDAFPPDGHNTGQDVTDLLSSILRIDVHHEQDGRPYTIPADNPFVSLEKARGEIWAYGVRNPWKMSFDRKSGDLWVGDVGWELWELVFRVRKGDNYGWSLVEGRQPVHMERQRGPTPIVPPTVEIPHTDGASVTGGFVYRGKKFPELDGIYLFGDWETRRIWGVKASDEQVGAYRDLVEPTLRIVDFAEDKDGELYLLDYDDGSIHALARNDVKQAQHPFPRKLSETGLFQSVADHRVADGVVPFSINSQQWMDHATAERFLGIPGDGAIQVHAKARQIQGSMFSRAMDFPQDAVLMKTLSLDLVQGDSSSRRKIETQVLHYDGRDWRGYTYEWNDEQTDASLVEAAGKTRTWQVTDPQSPGGHRTQTWLFASRNDCIRCHNPWSEYTLAFNLAQLNREHEYEGTPDNQIRALRHVGLLTDVLEQPDANDPFAKPQAARPVERLPQLADPLDASADLNERSRAYLHANCAHCHRYNGGGSAHIYLQQELALKDIKAVGFRPTQGTFGIHEAQILAPGDPFRSVLYFRVAKAGPGHMPHLGSKIVDERGLALLNEWIRTLPKNVEDINRIERLIQLDEPAILAREEDESLRVRHDFAVRQAQKEGRKEPNEADYRAAQKQATDQAASRAKQRAAERKKLVDELLATPSQAMLLAQVVRQQRLPDMVRQEALAVAANHADLAIRDLFEPFVPEEQRSKRLGEAIRPEEILKQAGDVESGRMLFHEVKTVQCRNCHRIEGKGTDLGPDLSKIGKKYDRPKLLETILDPSAVIEPQYLTWLVETKSGQVHTGLLVKKDEGSATIKDVQNKQHEIPIAEIEGMFPQRKSLMPDLLLRDFTLEQVADLLAYLASLK